MDNKILIWAIALVFIGSILFNTGDLTGNMTKAKDPIISISNPKLAAGSNLNMLIRNARTSQEFQIFNENDKYTGQRFFTRSSKCTRTSPGYYDCNLAHRIPSNLPVGKYYVQGKDTKTRVLIGSKAPFTIINSQSS